MPKEVYLVKVGMTMTEGTVDEWYIEDGAQVSKGDLIYRLETEKVNLDVDAEVDGTLRHLAEIGVNMEPGTVVGYIYEAGEEIPDVLPGAGGASAPAAAAATPDAAPAAVAAAPPAAAVRGDGGRILSSPAARRLAGELGVDIGAVGGTGPGGRVVEADVQAAHESGGAPAAAATGGPASPVARRLAREMSVDLATVAGTGPGGRITKEDVEQAAAAQAAAPARPAAVEPAAGDVIPLKGMRKTIATRMHESLHSMAQLSMDMEVDMDDAVKLREQLIAEWESEGIRPSYNDLVIRAVAKALRAHPLMNARFDDTQITLLDDINVGMAVAVDAGLVVPVVRGVDGLSIRDLALESARLAVAARDGKLTMDDFEGGTFTVSALGMFGVDSFTPIVNAPQAGILGVNRLYDGVAWDGDTPVKVKRMRLSLTWDHRILDGAPAAQFLQEVKALLEAPIRLLL